VVLCNGYSDLDLASLFCEFEGIGLKVEQHLFDSLFVRIDEWAMHASNVKHAIVDVLKGGKKPDPSVFSLLALHAHYILNRVSDIEFRDLLSELAYLNL